MLYNKKEIDRDYSLLSLRESTKIIEACTLKSVCIMYAWKGQVDGSVQYIQKRFYDRKNKCRVELWNTVNVFITLLCNSNN